MALSILGRPSEDVGIRVIHRVLDAGVTLLDTADIYGLDHSEIGHNERLIAKALRTWRGGRDHVVVATKAGMTRPGGPGDRLGRNGRPEHLRAACERSLRALQVDCLDLYQLHAPDPDVPFADSVGALAELRQAGKVRWIGLSNVTVEHMEIARAVAPLVSVQNSFNPRVGGIREACVVRYCAGAGMGYLAYSPVGGKRHSAMVAGHPVIRGIARRHGVSAQAVVLAWLLAKAPCVIPIPGARTVEHALDSMRAAGLQLSEDELRTIDRVRFPDATLYETAASAVRRIPGLRAAYVWFRDKLA